MALGPRPPKPGASRPAVVPAGRLESWKEIAAHLHREVRTVQRWERERGLPVHRVPGSKKGGVYASRVELDAWLAQERADVALTRVEPKGIGVARESGSQSRHRLACVAGRLATRWRLCLLAIPSLFFTIVTWQIHFRAPEQVGWTAIPANPGFIVEALRPGSAAGRAGVEPGDRILAWDGLPVYEFLRLRLIHAEAGRPYRLSLERSGQPREVLLIFHTRDWRSWLEVDGLTQIVFLLSATGYLLLAFVIAASRPEDAAARWGALLLGTIGITLMHVSCFLKVTGAFHAVRHLPGPLGGLFLAMIGVAVGALPAVLITFLSLFPCRTFQNRWVWAVIWAPNLARVLILFYWWRQLTYSPEAFHGFGWTANAGDSALFPFCLCALVILVRNAVRRQSGNQGRRARILLAGLGISLLGGVPIMIFGVASWDVVRRLTPAYDASIFPLISSLLYPCFPISVAYAILRHRLFDLHSLVRQGLSYAVARGALLSLAPLMAILLVADLWGHRNQQLAQTLSQRFWLYLAVGVTGVLLHWRRKFWFQALDRRFFREQYDARQILYALAEESRRARNIGQVLSHVVAQIDAALHPEFTAILVRSEGDRMFKAMAAVRQAPPPIPAGYKLVGFARLLERPLEVSPERSEWLRLHLPEAEVAFVRNAKLDWLFPIPIGGDRAEAFLVLGPKRSEEPYSREDEILLETVAANVGMAWLSAPPPPLASAEHIRTEPKTTDC